MLVGSCALVSPNGIPAGLEGIELYDWLAYEGIYDRDLGNQTVREVLEVGLSSEDSDVVGAAINAIVFYTTWIETDSWAPEEPSPIDRELQRIAGLKELLVELWEKEFARSPDFQNNQDLGEGMEFRNGRGFFSLSGVWQLIPNVLAVLYPGEPDAHRIVWEARAPNKVGQLLRRLDIGQFATKRDQDFRVSVLLDRSASDSDIARAALGLGKFRSDEGLEALVSRLEETAKYPTHAVGHLVEAVVEYGNDCLPHAELLRKTGRRLQIDEQIGVRYDSPRGYGVTPEVGKRHRIQVALEKLDELERATQDPKLKP